MKKLIAICALIILMGFKKKEVVPATDYRDVYVGNYACKRTYTHANSTLTALVSDVSTYTMSIRKGTVDSTMIVTINEGDFTLKLLYPNLVGNGPSIYGNFYGADSIYIKLAPGHAPNIYSYLGKKQGS